MSATGATLQPPITRARARHATLPYAWPLYAAFGLFPLWYVLGFGSLIWFFLAIEGVPLAAEESHDPKRDMPRGLIAGMGVLLVFAALMLTFAPGGSATLRYCKHFLRSRNFIASSSGASRVSIVAVPSDGMTLVR